MNHASLSAVAAEIGCNVHDVLTQALGAALRSLEEKINSAADSTEGFALQGVSHDHSVAVTESGAHVSVVVSIVALYAYTAGSA